MNKRRLLKLADLLEADAKNKKGIRFDMGTWGEVNDEAKPLSCGTTACAMGLAALSGIFKRAGVGYYITRGGGLLITMNGGGDAVGAAQDLFSISHAEAVYLFTESEEVGAKGERAIAARIRRFVKEGGCPADHWSRCKEIELPS